MNINRRSFVARLAALAGAASLPGSSPGQGTPPPSKTRLVLLGTGGGPRPRKNSAATAQVILVNESAYVIDCGDGVARQLAFAGVPLATLRHIFITHHHSDHNADYGNLMWLAWTAGLRTRVDTWGPPPLENMTRLFLEMNGQEIDTRIADEGRVPLEPLVHAHELREAGVVMEDENVKVTSALVNHPPVVPAFGYRFDTADRSIVISGDTTPSENLAKLAEGADVLVHEAMNAQAVERMRIPPALKRSILSHHTSAEDAGRLAQSAGVKLLVLSHFVPPDDNTITDQMWIDAARTHFAGRVIVGKDLLEV